MVGKYRGANHQHDHLRGTSANDDLQIFLEPYSLSKCINLKVQLDRKTFELVAITYLVCLRI
jgi:hypothetical protein